jgi:hypothetical protein
MSTDTIRTHRIASGDVVSGQEALSGLEFAESEVQRAEIRLADVERWNAERLDGARSWLAECRRRLRIATMQQRRLSPVVHGEPMDPAPWLPQPDPLFDWRSKITLTPATAFEDD